MNEIEFQKQLEQAVDESGVLRLETPIISPFLSEEFSANLCGSISLTLTDVSFGNGGEAILIKGKGCILGLDHSELEIRLSPADNPVSAAVRAQIPSDRQCILAGFGWVCWDSLELSLEIDAEKGSRSGQITGTIQHLAGHQLDGHLVVITQEDGSIENRYWLLEDTDGSAARLDLLAPPKGSSTTFDLIAQKVTAFFDQRLEGIRVELQPDLSSGWANTLSLATGFSWNMFPQVTVNNLRVFFSRAGSPEILEMDTKIAGEMILEKKGQSLLYSGSLAQDQKGMKYRLGLRTGDEEVLTLQDMIDVFVPEFQDQLKLPENVTKKLEDNGFSVLEVYLAPGEPAFSFQGIGRLFGLDGEAQFSIQPYLDGTVVSFEIQTEAEPMSITDMIENVLGIPVGEDVKAHIPGIRVALWELAFDQVDETFRIKAAFEPARKDAYRLVGGLNLQWSDGIRMGLVLDASELPVKLAELEKDLPVSLEPVKQVMPEPVYEKISATEFHRLGINIDTAAESFSVEGAANLFGELLVSASFSFFKENDQPCIILIAEVFADPLSIRKIPALVGLTDAGSQADYVGLLPDLGMGLNQIVLDQQQDLFSISGTVVIGDTRATTLFGVKRKNEKDDLLFDIEFKGDKERPPSLIALLGAVIPNVEAGDIDLPGDFDIILKKLDFSLDTAKKDVTGAAEGALVIAGVPLTLTAQCEKADDPWIFAGQSEPDEKISLTALTADILTTIDPDIVLPPGIPDISFVDVAFSVNTQTKEFSFKSKASIESTLPVRGKDCALGLGMDINYNPEKADPKLTGTFDGSLTIGSVAFLAGFNLGEPALSLKLDEGNTLNFKEAAEFLLGEGLFDTLPKDLTRNLAGVEVSKFDSALDFANGAVELEVTTTFKDMRLGTDDLRVDEANITLKLEVSESRQYCLIDMGGAGQIGPAIIFEDCRFKFELDRKDGKTDWSLGGVFDAEILGHDLRLEAGFKDVAGTKTLALLARDPFPAIEFPGVGSFELDEFKLLVEKKADRKASFALSTTFQLATDADIFELRSGTVALINHADKTGLKLFADGIDMKFPAMDQLPWFTLDEPLLDLTYNKKSKQWSCHGKTGFISHNVPDMLNRVFPVEKLEAECTINAKKAEFLVRLEDGLIQIPAPMDVGDFGHAYIGVNEMKINLMQGGSLTAKLSFGLPVGLNAIFQPPAEDDAQDKKGKLEIFRVYDPDAKEELIGLDLTISTERGLICELDQSPFKFFSIEADEVDRKIIDIDLKEFGQIAVVVPVFSLEPDGSFSASGGFDIKRELQFPLTPFKYLLRQIGLAAVSAALPNGIPIKGIQFYSEEEGFQSDAFFELFTPDADQVPLPDWLREGFDAVDDILNRLPGDFLAYGNIEVPRHLNFDVEFSPSGSLKFEFSVKDPANEDESVPLKLLLPAFPNFIGIELYSIAFGELFGGMLLRLDLDVKIDTFDLPSLLAALLIPYGELPQELKALLPDPKKVQNSFRAENLVAPIIYQAVVPIPIPLFYDELSVTYKGLDGFELKSMFSFKKPTFDLASVGLLFGELTSFFTMGQDIDLVKLEKVTLGDYTIGPNYIRLPKYVSVEETDPPTVPPIGKLLGTRGEFTIKPVKFIGALLNAIKNLSINDLIQVVEVDRRVGDIDLTLFNVLNIEFQCALTTPFEFVDYAYKKLSGLDQSQARQFISILPPKRTGIPATVDAEYTYSPVTEDSEGLIIFLKGDLEIANALVFKTGFGLAATGEGFGMGMQFDGRLTNIFAVHMKGLVAIRKDGKFLLSGDSYLRILEQNILSGKFRFSNEAFQIEAQAGDGPVRVQGLLEGEFSNHIFRLEGRTSLVLFGLTADGTAKFLITDTEKLIYLHGKIRLGDFIRLEAGFKSYADLSQAGMSLFIRGNLSALLELSLEGAALVEANGAFQAKGAASMKVLTHEVISANFEFINDALSFNGRLDLFPQNKLMVVKGDVTGILSDDRFELSGDCTIILVGCKFAGAMVLISDKEFIFTSRLFNQKAFLLMKRHDSGFTLYGTMSPIIIGEILRISCTDDAAPIAPYDLGGPSIYISTSPESAGFRLNGKVSILGIESSTDILFSEKGFYFKISGRLFKVIEGSFTAIGRDFNDSKNILIKGEIKTGDLQGDAINMIKQIANDVDEQIRNFDKSLADKKRFLTEQQKKVNKLNSEINKCKTQINRLKKQISKKKVWCNSAPWYAKPARLVVLGAFVIAKGAEMAALYAKIGVLEGAKLTALGALEIAKAALSATQKVLEGARAVTNKLAGFSIAALKAAGDILTIRSASFETELNSICAGATTMNFDVRFLGKDYKLENIRYNFFQPQVAVKSIVDALTKK
jgi:hypothetical protein